MSDDSDDFSLNGPPEDSPISEVPSSFFDTPPSSPVNSLQINTYINGIYDIHKKNSGIEYLWSVSRKFVTKWFEDYIINVINNYIPRINNKDRIFITKLTILSIENISNKYSFKSSLEHGNYYNKWKEDNNSNIKSIILQLLPYFDEEYNVNHFVLNVIESLSELVITRSEDLDKFKNNDNEIISSEYFKYSNRYLDIKEPYTSDIIYKIMKNNFDTLLYTSCVMNHKYYINWVNIVPIKSIDELDREFIDETNYFYYSSIKNLHHLLTNFYEYNGLWLGDIYNTVRVRMYEEIKDIKWLLYAVDATNSIESGQIIDLYQVDIIDELFDITYILDSCNEYNCNDNNTKIIFSSKFSNIENKIRSGNISVIDTVKDLLIKLTNNNEKIYNCNDSYKFQMNHKKNLKTKNENENEDFNTIEEDKYFDYTKDNENIKNSITDDDLIKLLNYIKNNFIDIMWAYIHKRLYLFYYSFYGKYFFQEKNDKIIFSRNTSYHYNINLKYIYNISKSLCHTSLKEWEDFPINYIDLSYKQKYLFFTKINIHHHDYDDWLNIYKVYDKIEQKGRNIDYTKYQKKKELLNKVGGFIGTMTSYILEDMIRRGLLSNFVLNPNITSDASETQKIKIMKIREYFKENKNKWKDCYYYLTYYKYNNIDTISENCSWMNFYSLNWLCQINFYRHFIFNRVMYITGATGQGKSTQMPKLYLYALLAINYNAFGKVLCSAPRVSPTQDNCKRISLELGYVINDSNINDINNKYYVQYRTKESSYYNPTIYHKNITIATDGTILQELTNNITVYSSSITSLNKNKFDVLFIDETHEHNKNMDLILTYVKSSCIYNNNIKLAVVSATMKDDEPRYRWFYKIINDKSIKYIPHNDFIKYSWGKVLDDDYNLKECEYLYSIDNSSMIDRRFHISAPGKGTQYKITEHYLQDENGGINGGINPSNLEKYKFAEKKGIEKTIELSKNSLVEGHLLFFSIGENEALNIVTILNNDSNMPKNIIILPYYSVLSSAAKDIIKNIKDNLYKIRIDRKDITKIFTLKNDNEFNSKISQGNNVYDRVILVATDIAEASITIQNLYYVVDTGYRKSSIFDHLVLHSNLVIEEISESSRIQRKGRVGRIADGEIYYMYAKEARKNNKPFYGISQSDPSDIVYELMKDNKDTVKINFDNVDNIYVSFEVKVSTNWYSSGIPLDNIIDIEGKFYLVHYFEDKIKRNIYGEIINDNNLIDIENYKFMIYKYYSLGLLSDYKFTNKVDILKIKKTELFGILKILRKINLFNLVGVSNLEYDLILIHSLSLKCERNIIDIIFFLKEKIVVVDKAKSIYSEKIKDECDNKAKGDYGDKAKGDYGDKAKGDYQDKAKADYNKKIGNLFNVTINVVNRVRVLISGILLGDLDCNIKKKKYGQDLLEYELEKNKDSILQLCNEYKKYKVEVNYSKIIRFIKTLPDIYNKLNNIKNNSNINRYINKHQNNYFINKIIIESKRYIVDKIINKVIYDNHYKIIYSFILIYPENIIYYKYSDYTKQKDKNVYFYLNTYNYSIQNIYPHDVIFIDYKKENNVIIIESKNIITI